MNDHRGSVLVIDDDAIVMRSLVEMLRAEQYASEGVQSMSEAISILSERPFDVVITDINMPEADGFEVLRAVKSKYPNISVVVITGYGTIESAVEAIKMGAYDYLTKPIIDDEIRLVVSRAMEQSALVRECESLRHQLEERFGIDNVVGQDYKMRKVYDLIEAVSGSTVNVLVEGESGTGKSMIARVIHQRSDRRSGPFIEVSCGAIPESLLESELFGHVRGAFTGAVSNKPGKFKAADGGTIFLDEIATASPALQVKLLRVLQEREFEPIGSNKTDKVDVRVIMATNVDLEKEVEAGRFRQDLFYRINVVTISLPNLAERLGDIPLLADRFLTQYNSEAGKHIIGFTDDALRILQAHHWPGNVRELENAVERAVVLARDTRIGVSDLPPKLVSSAGNPRASVDVAAPASLKESLAEPERRLIEAALKRNDWCRQATADELEINRTTLYKKMKRYGLIHRGVEQPVGSR